MNEPASHAKGVLKVFGVIFAVIFAIVIFFFAYIFILKTFVEVKTIDPFEHIEVEFLGVDRDIVAKVRSKDSCVRQDAIFFYPKERLYEGGKLEVCIDELKAGKRFKFSRIKKIYKVKSDCKRIKRISDIPKKDLKEIEELLRSRFDEEVDIDIVGADLYEDRYERVMLATICRTPDSDSDTGYFYGYQAVNIFKDKNNKVRIGKVEDDCSVIYAKLSDLRRRYNQEESDIIETTVKVKNQ